MAQWNWEAGNLPTARLFEQANGLEIKEHVLWCDDATGEYRYRVGDNHTLQIEKTYTVGAGKIVAHGKAAGGILIKWDSAPSPEQVAAAGKSANGSGSRLRGRAVLVSDRHGKKVSEAIKDLTGIDATTKPVDRTPKDGAFLQDVTKWEFTSPVPPTLKDSALTRLKCGSGTIEGTYNVEFTQAVVLDQSMPTKPGLYLCTNGDSSITAICVCGTPEKPLYLHLGERTARGPNPWMLTAKWSRRLVMA